MNGSHILLGFLLGVLFVGLLTYAIPQHFRGVQEWLVDENHAYYDTKTQDFVLKVMKEEVHD